MLKVLHETFMPINSLKCLLFGMQHRFKSKTTSTSFQNSHIEEFISYTDAQTNNFTLFSHAVLNCFLFKTITLKDKMTAE